MTQCILSILPLVPLPLCLSLDPAPVETGPLFALVFLNLTVLYRHASLCATDLGRIFLPMDVAAHKYADDTL